MYYGQEQGLTGSGDPVCIFCLLCVLVNREAEMSFAWFGWIVQPWPAVDFWIRHDRGLQPHRYRQHGTSSCPFLSRTYL